MAARRVLSLLLPCAFLTGALLATAAPADAQIFDKLKEAVADAKSTVDDAKSTFTDAKALRCEVDGTCGEVWQSDLFAPELYGSLAVTVFDASGRFRTLNPDGLARNAFEGTLVENGFLLAASADADAVRERIGRSDDDWSDEDLAQLGDFVQGIDGVVVVQIDQVALGRCELEGGGNGTEATVHLSARWLNVDAGDVPWVGRHHAIACGDGGAAALTAALDKVSVQLAGVLPALE